MLAIYINQCVGFSSNYTAFSSILLLAYWKYLTQSLLIISIIRAIVANPQKSKLMWMCSISTPTNIVKKPSPSTAQETIFAVWN